MMTFKERLTTLWPNDTIASISERIGLSQMGLYKIFSKESLPKAEVLLSINELTGCDLKWLMSGIGEPFPNLPYIHHPMNSHDLSSTPMAYDTLGYEVDVSEFVFIPRYDIYASAGNGHFNGNERPTHTMAFRRYWIENYLMADPADLFIITVKGDSMPGVVEDKDVIMVNRSLKPGNGIYLVRIAEELIVKHVQTVPGGDLLVKSTNEIYEQFIIDSSPKYHDVSILGGIQWLGRTL